MYLQHVNVYVRNVERSKKWYEELLGLHVYEYRSGWAAFLTADKEQSHEVALMQLGDDAPLQSKAEGQPIERIIDPASRSASTCATLTATASKCSTRCRVPSGRSTTTYSRVRRPGAVASLALGMPRSAASLRRRGGQPLRSRTHRTSSHGGQPDVSPG
jgi:hypothetical protein